MYSRSGRGDDHHPFSFDGVDAAAPYARTVAVAKAAHPYYATLEKDPTRSFDNIAEVLNRKKRAQVPPGVESWTAEIVRNVYVSLPLPRPSAEPE